MSTILITDDNPQNVYLSRYLLEQRGHTIIEARNGQEAVNICNEQPVDLVLMDIQMPVMGGLEATRLIKQNPEPPVIIALSGKVTPADRESFLNAGCDGYIGKPVEPARFPDQVENHLRQAITIRDSTR